LAPSSSSLKDVPCRRREREATYCNSTELRVVNSEVLAIEITPNVAVIEQRASDLEMVGAGPNLSDRVGDLTAVINKTAVALVESISSLEQLMRPDKVEAEFSIGFSAEAGFWYIAKGVASGAMKVKLEWTLPKK
jgi:hypothetical protein